MKRTVLGFALLTLLAAAASAETIIIKIGDGDDDATTDTRTIVIPKHRRLLLDGVPALRGMTETWYVCPKDHTIVRIPKSKADDDATYKCPLDGSPLEKRKGRGLLLMIEGDNVSDL